MNKLLLSTLISASLTSTVFAASLDVHGEIKVNGKTVIDENGQVLQAGSESKTYSYADYFLPSGVTIHRTEKEYQEWDGTVVESLVVEEVAADGSWVYSVYTSGGDLSWQEHFTPTANGYKSSYQSGDGEWTCETTAQYVDPTLTISEMTLGGSYARIRTTNATTQCDEQTPTVSTRTGRTTYSLVAHTDYKNGELELADCIIVERNYFSSRDVGVSNYSSLETLCNGVGSVEFLSENYEQKAILVEFSGTAQTKSSGIPRIEEQASILDRRR